MAMDKEKIMVTSIGGRAGYNLVRCMKESPLGKSGSFVGADMNPDCVKLICDEYATIPSPRDENYITAMQEIVDKFEVDLLIPTSDEECLALSKQYLDLGNIKTIPIGKYEGVLSAKDKFMLYEKTKKLGAVPKTVEIQQNSTIKEIEEEIGLPAFIKPRMGRGGRYTHLVKDSSHEEKKELYNFWGSFNDDFGTPICQTFLNSNDYGIDTYTDENGKTNFGAMRKKLSVMTGDRVVGMRAVSINEPKMEELSKKIIDTLGLKGFVEIEMRRDPSGTFYAMDVNPRVGGSIYLSKASGRNIAMLPILDLSGEPHPVFNYKTGIELRRKEIEKGDKKFFWDYIFPKDPDLTLYEGPVFTEVV